MKILRIFGLFALFLCTGFGYAHAGDEYYSFTLNDNGGSGGRVIGNKTDGLLHYGVAWGYNEDRGFEALPGAGNTPVTSTNPPVITEAPTTTVPHVHFYGYALDQNYTISNTENRIINSARQFFTDQRALTSFRQNNTTLYAIWAPNNYQIQLDDNGDNITRAGQVYSSSGYSLYKRYGTDCFIVAPTLNTNELEQNTCISSIYQTPQRTGYTFAGYWTVSQGTGGTMIVKPNGDFETGTSTTFTQNSTIYARWTPKVLTITLDKNNSTSGATDSNPTTVYLKYNTGWFSDATATTSISHLTTNPERPGYTFGGFTKRANGGTQVIDSSGEFLTTTAALTVLSENGSIYAQWTGQNTYTIQLRSNGGDIDYAIYHRNGNFYCESSATTQILSTQNIFDRCSFTKPSSAAGEFDGYWSATSAGSQYIDREGKILYNSTVTGGMRWYAQYQATCGSLIALEPNGGSFSGICSGFAPTPVQNNNGDWVLQPLGNGCRPTQNGVTFAGYYYYDENSGTYTQYYDDSLTAVGTWPFCNEDKVVLIALWNHGGCNCGEYIPAGYVQCVECPIGSYCSGVISNQVPYNADQGIESCAKQCGGNGYTSDAGACNINECYQACKTDCMRPNDFCAVPSAECQYTNSSVDGKEYCNTNTGCQIPNTNASWCEISSCPANSYYDDPYCKACNSGFSNNGGMGGADTCVKDCSVQCTWDDNMCPANATCTHTQSSLSGNVNQTQDQDKCYSGGNQIMPFACEFSFTCNEGYEWDSTTNQCVMTPTCDTQVTLNPDSGNGGSFASNCTYGTSALTLTLNTNDNQWYLGPSSLPAGCAATRDGYTFAGYTYNNNRYYADNLNVVSNQPWDACNLNSAVLTADWTAKCNEITFNENYGNNGIISGVSQHKLTADTDWYDGTCKSTVTASVTSLDTTGHRVFKGFYLSSNNTDNTDQVFDASGAPTNYGNNWTINANTVLYAHWDCDTGYEWDSTTNQCVEQGPKSACDSTATLDPNGGDFTNTNTCSGEINPIYDFSTNTWSAPASLNAGCRPIRTGYTFNGYVGENNGPMYYDSNLYRSTPLWPNNCNVAKINLVAGWTGNCMEIQFDDNNAAGTNVNSQNHQHKQIGNAAWMDTTCGKELLNTPTAYTPTNDHATFLGYYTEKNSTSGIRVFDGHGNATSAGNGWTISGTATSPVTLYARWDCDTNYNWDSQTKACVQKPYEVRVKCNPEDTNILTLTYLAYNESMEFSDAYLAEACKNAPRCNTNWQQEDWNIYLNAALTQLSNDSPHATPITITGGDYNNATKITFVPNCVEDTYSVKYKCYKDDSNGKVDNEVPHSNYTVQPIRWYEDCKINENSSMPDYFNGWLFSGDGTEYSEGDTISNWSYGNNATFVPVYNATFDCNTDHWQAPSGGNPTTQTVVLGDSMTMPAMSCVPKSAYAGWVNTNSEWNTIYAAAMETPVPSATCSAGNVTANGGTTFNWNCPTNLTFTPDDELITKTIEISCGTGGTTGTIEITYDTQNQTSTMVNNWLHDNCGGHCHNPSGDARGYLKFCGTWGNNAVPNVTQIPGTNCWRAERDYNLNQINWANVTEFNITAISHCPKYVNYKCSADATEVYNEPPYSYMEDEYRVLDHSTVGCDGYGYELENWVKEDDESVTFDENETVASWPYDESITLVAQWKYCPDGQYWDEATGTCLSCAENTGNQYKLSKAPYNWSIDQCYRKCSETCVNTDVTQLYTSYDLQKFESDNLQVEFYGNSTMNPGTCGHVTYCPYVIKDGDTYVFKVRGVPVNFIDNNNATVDTYHIVGAGNTSDDVAAAFLWSQIVGSAQKYQFTVSGNTHYSVPIVYPIYSAPYNEPAGYTFNGYYNPRGGHKYVQDDAELSKTIAQSAVDGINAATGDLHRDLYAGYDSNEYTVTYQCGAGSGADTTNTATYGDGYDVLYLADTPCQYTGHDFLGWKYMNGTDYDEGEHFTWEYTDANPTFTAQWSGVNTYNIIYENMTNAEASATGMPTTYVYGTGATINGVPTRPLSEFQGWCTDASLEHCAMTQTISASETGDKTFWAKWECISPYHSNPEGTACVACPDDTWWNSSTQHCDPCPQNFPHSKHPMTWSEGQCYRECPTNTALGTPGQTCRTDPDMGAFSVCTGMVKFEEFANSNGRQIEFKGNFDDGQNTCNAVENVYCPRGISGCPLNTAFKPMTAPVEFHGKIPEENLGARYIFGSRGGHDTIDLSSNDSNKIWSFMAGPGQKTDVIHNEVGGVMTDYYYTHIIYPTYNAPDAEVPGYTFNGYYYPRTGGEQYVASDYALNATNAQSVLGSQSGDSNTARHLYATVGNGYTQNEYSITYSCGTATGGTVPESQTGIHINQSVTPRENTCEKPGYEFQGWIVSGTDEVKPAGAAGTFTWEYTESKTFTAKWNDDPIAYNINYHNTDNATWGTGNPPNTYTVTNLPLTIDAAMTRPHSTFMGWCTDAALTTNCEMTHTIPVGTTGDVDFWAKWECVPPYHSNPAGTACEACDAGQYWNGVQCEYCSTTGFPNSTPPFNWSADQCWRSCQNDVQCAVPSASIIGNIGGCSAQAFRNTAGTQIEFKGNHDAGVQTCDATNVPYCPYGLDCSAENVDMPRSVMADFHSGEGWPSVGTRHVIGLGNWSTGANNGTMVSGNMWSAIVGPAQKMELDDHNPDDQYTFITYPANVAPTATAVSGQIFKGYYDQQTGGNRRVDDDYELNAENAQGVGVTMSSLIPGDRNLYARWQQCDVNTYQHNNECIHCNEGFTSPVGASGPEECTKSCSVACEWDDSMCPDHASCTHTEASQIGIVNQIQAQQAQGTCYHETTNEPIFPEQCVYQFTCDDGYGIMGNRCVPCEDGEYLENGRCTACPNGYPYSDANATQQTQCYKSCQHDCDEPTCPIASGTGTCTYTHEATNGKWYFNSNVCIAQSSICQMTLSCYDGYTLEGNECKPTKYTITYKSNEDATQNETQEVTYSESFETKGAIFTSPGYIMTAWSAPYTLLKHEYPAYNTPYDTTLIAQWEMCPAGTYQNANTCTDCPDGYRSDAGASGQNQCYRSCEKPCDDVLCPEHSVSCEKSKETFDGIQYYEAPCVAETQQCRILSVICDAGYYQDGTKCEPCPENYSSIRGAVGVDACFLVSCPDGQHVEYGECKDDVIPCDAPNATNASRKWNETLRAYGSCIVAACETNYHVASNACTADTRACAVEGGRGEQVWDGNKWGDCEITQCNPGFIDNGNTCVECPNRRVDGEIAVSSYATECEIASCMYQGQKYALEGDRCEPICNKPDDGTGHMEWNESQKKCVRTCNPGYKMW